MPIHYELLLRTDLETLDDPIRLLDDLGRIRRLEVAPDGAGLMETDGGVVRVSPYPPRGSERAVPKTGLDFRLPAGLPDDLCRDLIAFCLDLARQWRMEIYDPQMGRTVTTADAEAIFLHWKEQNAYLLHTVGSDGSVTGGGAHYPEYSTALSKTTVFWLAVGGLVAAFFVLTRLCT